MPSCSPRSAAGWARGSSISGSPDLDRPAAPDLLVATSVELEPEMGVELRALFDAAWRNKGGSFDDHDFEHASWPARPRQASGPNREPRLRSSSGPSRWMGSPCEPVTSRRSHAPELQGRGLGTAVMRRLGGILEAEFELGALSTSVPEFTSAWGGALARADVRADDQWPRAHIG
jgi:hypothetical protein